MSDEYLSRLMERAPGGEFPNRMVSHGQKSSATQLEAMIAETFLESGGFEGDGLEKATELFIGLIEKYIEDVDSYEEPLKTYIQGKKFFKTFQRFSRSYRKRQMKKQTGGTVAVYLMPAVRVFLSGFLQEFAIRLLWQWGLPLWMGMDQGMPLMAKVFIFRCSVCLLF